MANTAKHEWPMVPLSELVKFQSGGTPATKNLEFYGGDIPWITSADISEDHAVKPQKFVTEAAIANSAACIAESGSILLVTRIGVGKCAIVDRPLSYSQDITNLVDLSDGCDARYLIHFLQSSRRFFESRSRGVTIKGIKRSDLIDLLVPLPPIDEQRRIATILGQVEELVRAQNAQITHIDSLLQQAIESMLVGREVSRELGQIAEIQSGITKGRKVTVGADLGLVPYLAVSNVKDGYLDMDSVKQILATELEISRYRLEPGDVVLTEGGDPDKLGRGTVWNNERPLCIHQNHIFRVRIRKDATNLTPSVLAAILQTTALKKYFVKSAKQTTGIASINKTQLSKAPIPVLSEEQVARVAQVLETISAERKRAENSLAQLIKLSDSLFTRAFQGEL